MKNLIIAVLLFSSLAVVAQSPDIQKARATSKAEHKFILVTFTGSDWCIPCIRMEKEVFLNDMFVKYAKENLVIVQADFPRLKKHGLSSDQQRQNEALAEKYNNKGVFPLTVLLDAEGKVVKEWEGIVAESPEKFIQQLVALQHAR